MNTGIERYEGSLILAGAPIGRPQDASAALIEALGKAHVVAAEDTRRLRRLAAALKVKVSGRLVSFYEDVESSKVPALIGELTAGHDVLLITDAGMPSVSDPGYRLVTAAIEAGLPVTVVPGPSAVTAALAVSGLPSDRFCFEGFPPRKVGERTRRFTELASERRTMVFFESPRRLGSTLKALADAFGQDRTAAVCRELTKTHEEIVRGSLGELTEWAQQEVLGEITVVVGGVPDRRSAARLDPVEVADEAAEAVAAGEATGMTRAQAMAATAARLGMRKREVYEAVLQAKARHT
ncbi:MAG TPA: 16S rRNA (cytidine(1402)-2'-O)-methyltransferase [Streptosporangiaceae bacterium]|jgi:16S rRNA (cytidine1402-2'-O)-methyltransferase|nr:16S rRNA (cytidine(1402)-2'-O)-methyltransferase [Streptosporangiaceae bacterium]